MIKSTFGDVFGRKVAGGFYYFYTSAGMCVFKSGG